MIQRIALLFLAFIALNAKAEVRGQIFSSDTKVPIGYASVGSASQSFGMVADSIGCFHFDRSIESNDSIIVSCIGYYPRVISTQSVSDSIFLTPKQELLQEVIVNPRKKKKLGNLYGKSGLGWILVTTDDKKEVGRVFNLSNDCVVSKIRMNVFTPYNVKLRLNVYQYDNKEWKNILNENIFWPTVASDDENFDNHVYELALEQPLILEKGKYLFAVEDVSNTPNPIQFVSRLMTGKAKYRSEVLGDWQDLPVNLSMEIDIEY